jgi:hypothetical protein
MKIERWKDNKTEIQIEIEAEIMSHKEIHID